MAMDMAERPTFELFCASLYNTRFTGSIVIHFRNGIPKEIDVPRPVHVKLATP